MIGIGNRIGAIALAAASATICSPPSAIASPFTQRPKKSTRRESAISNHYTDIVVCSSRNVAMMASGSMRSRNSILTCRAATSPSRPTINLAAIGRK